MESKQHEELMATYKIAIDDIRDSKHQQWRIIQLTLLAIAAIVSIHKYSRCSISPDVLMFITSVVGVLGILFIWSFAYSLSKYRKKKEAIREKFVDTVKKIEEGSLWDCWFDKVVKGFQVTPVFAALFTLFIGIAMFIAISILKSIP